jgi:hypothetical protein
MAWLALLSSPFTERKGMSLLGMEGVRLDSRSTASGVVDGLTGATGTMRNASGMGASHGQLVLFSTN